MEHHISIALPNYQTNLFLLKIVLVFFMTYTCSLVEAQNNLGHRPHRESLSQPEAANGRLLPIIGHQDFHIERPQTFQRPKQLQQFEQNFSHNERNFPRMHGIEQIVSDHEKRLRATPKDIHTSRGVNSETQEERSAPKFGIPKSMGHLFDRPAGGGCDSSGGFHMAGAEWYSRGCRRHKCVNFRGESFIETDQCDTEIYNTVYKCIIEVDLKANYPHCCPRYKCNPDNLGNKVPDKEGPGSPNKFSTNFNIFS